MSTVKRTSVRLTAKNPVQVEDFTVPSGTYEGVMTAIGLHTLKGVEWTAPTYIVEFTEQQVGEMGGKTNPNYLSAEYDVTKQVTSGQFTVS